MLRVREGTLGQPSPRIQDSNAAMEIEEGCYDAVSLEHAKSSGTSAKCRRFLYISRRSIPLD